MMTEMAGIEPRKVDYVLSFSQATIDSDVYLHLPTVFHVVGGKKCNIFSKIKEESIRNTSRSNKLV